MHLARLEPEPAEASGENGSNGVIRLAQPAVRALRPAGRRRASLQRDDED
jgi:hypothetical protein